MGDSPGVVNRYPLALRLLHWIRAALILGLLGLGLIMVSLPDAAPAKFATLYPLHTEFGVLLFCVAVTQMLVRSRSVLPGLPKGLSRWEAVLSKTVHRAMIALIVIVPLMGYSMSSSFTQSDGVPFFGVELPELLPKNDDAFAVFQALHKYLAYTLIVLIALHVAGAVKHRLFDRGGDTDVLQRML